MTSNTASRFISFVLACTCLVTLSACASKMSKDECQSTDFYAMGLKDGENGRSTEALNKANDECHEYGINVSADKYNYGRQVGLTKYCSASQAKKDAAQGQPNSVCTGVPPYNVAYKTALEEARKDKAADLEKIKKNQSDLEKQEAQLQGDLNKIKEQQQTAPSTQ